MKNIRLGIAGTGMIAKVIAKAAEPADGVTLQAVSSRTLGSAQVFAEQFGIPVALGSYEELAGHPEVDAVYIGVPTSCKEEIALQAARNGKHILVDKPFTDTASLKRIAGSASEHGVAFMDGTHFVHHPRTQTIKNNISEYLGDVQSVNTSFFFPFPDGENIRFRSDLEPGGPIADLAWYSIRAAIEYMPEVNSISDQTVFTKEDGQTGVTMHGAGLIRFNGKRTSAWQVGYDAGTIIMDLSIIGSSGLIQADDYTLDWDKGFPFEKPGGDVDFTLRQEMDTSWEFRKIKTPSEKSAQSLMLENFAKLVWQPELRGLAADKSILTQQLLDQVLVSAQNGK
ncbi:MAG: Gfo/Idh/MocA family oxidoreductase [Balneolales bacterium]